MDLIGTFHRIFAAAKGVLSPVVPPKVPNKQLTLPAYRTNRVASSSAIRVTDRLLANKDLLEFRTGRDTPTVVRDLVASSPDLSAAISTYLRVGIPENFICIGRNMDGTVNPEATGLAMQLLRRFTYVPDYALGFNPQGSVQSISEMLAKELLQFGAMAGELVLDKTRLPTQVVTVSTTTLKFYEEGAGIRPVQEIGGVETNLDIPTFIYISVDQDQLNAYASSYIEAAIQPVLADAEFTRDLRRVLKRAVHPRIVASIVEERLRTTISPEILNDPEAYAAELNRIIAAIESTVNSLNPEDAIVSFDAVEYAYMEGTPGDLAGTFERVQEMLNAKVATGSKTMPAVLGHTSSANAASAETMLYLKHADLVRRKLNEFWSRMLTVAVRLFGEDVYIDFQYDKLDLRPDAELEAFKAMKQDRILKLVSVGMLTDEEACVELTGQLPPPGMKPLAGTMFMDGGLDPIENPKSGTSVMDKTTKPSTPAAPKSGRGPKASFSLIQ